MVRHRRVMPIVPKKMVKGLVVRIRDFRENPEVPFFNEIMAPIRENNRLLSAFMDRIYGRNIVTHEYGYYLLDKAAKKIGIELPQVDRDTLTQVYDMYYSAPSPQQFIERITKRVGEIRSHNPHYMSFVDLSFASQNHLSPDERSRPLESGILVYDFVETQMLRRAKR